jgi:hypothetical protein
MKRLCFLSPNQTHARHVVADLKGQGIPEQQIYAIAKEGIELEGLPDAGPEVDDFLPAYERGVALGGTAALLAGLAAMVFPGTGIVIGGGMLLLYTLFGAGFGGLLTAIGGAAFPSSRLQEFELALEKGQILVMVDVPAKEVEKYEMLIRKLDPEVRVEGIEPVAKVIP